MNTILISKPLADLIVSYAAPLSASSELPPLINTMQRYNAIAIQEIACALLGAQEQSVPLADRQWKRHLNLIVHCFRDIIFAHLFKELSIYDEYGQSPDVKLWIINPNDPYPFKQFCRNMVYLSKSSYLPADMLHNLPPLSNFFDSLPGDTIKLNAKKFYELLKACSIRSFGLDSSNAFFQRRPLHARNFLEDCEFTDGKNLQISSPLSSYCFSYRLSTHLLALAWRMVRLATYLFTLTVFFVLAIPTCSCLLLNNIANNKLKTLTDAQVRLSLQINGKLQKLQASSKDSVFHIYCWRQAPIARKRLEVLRMRANQGEL